MSSAGSWRLLLARRHLATSTVLASSVLLYATNELLTVSLLPSAVADIGGERLYAWATTGYQVGAVVAATTVFWLLSRMGARSSFLFALSVFAIGSIICALAPSMAILVAARVAQGAAGGLLAGLGYALINVDLPKSLWTRASALVSVMWGVAMFFGPAIGGVFAHLGLWRWSFGVSVILAALVAILVPIALADSGVDHGGAQPAATKVPLWSLLLLGAAVILVSVADVHTDMVATVGLFIAGAVLVGLFVIVDQWISHPVLPPTVFGSGPLKWIYVTAAAVAAATMVEMYVPLFGQRFAHLTPVEAAFLCATLMVGWTGGEIVSASLSNARTIARVVVAGPLVMLVGLVLAAATQRDNAPIGVVMLWALALLILGAGGGSAWPHLAAWAMSDVDDPAEGSEAAAAFNTVQLIAKVFGAGLAGVVVNNSRGGQVMSARWLFAVFTIFCGVAAIAAYRASRRHL